MNIFDHPSVQQYVIVAGIVVAASLLAATCSRAEEAKPDPRLTCQTSSPCKVIVLSKDEEDALLGQNKILDTAMQGRPLDLLGAVNYFRDKIRNAPAGVPAKVEEKK